MSRGLNVPTTSLKWRRLLSRRFNSSRVPSPRYFTATMLANYRHCITIHLFFPLCYYEATFLSLSLLLSAVCPIFGPPTYGWGVMHERGTLAVGERRRGNQSEEGLWNNNEVSVSRSSASVMHGIYVKGNSSKRYKRGIRTYRGLDRTNERERWMYKECRGRERKRERKRERGLPVRCNFTTRKNCRNKRERELADLPLMPRG